MTKVEFLERFVSPSGAKIEASAGFIKITHSCGCLLIQTAGSADYAELCGKHTKEYANRKDVAQ